MDFLENLFSWLFGMVALYFIIVRILPKPEEKVSVDELCANYRRYAGKKVRVRGIVKSINPYTITIHRP